MTPALTPERLAEIEAMLKWAPEPFDRDDALRDQGWRVDAKAAIRDLLAERRGGEEPDACYQADDNEAYPWEERDFAVEEWDRSIGKVIEVRCMRDLPSKWVTPAVLSRDGDGDADETEMRWFDSREEAEQFARTQVEPPRG